MSASAQASSPWCGEPFYFTPKGGLVGRSAWFSGRHCSIRRKLPGGTETTPKGNTSRPAISPVLPGSLPRRRPSAGPELW